MAESYVQMGKCVDANRPKESGKKEFWFDDLQSKTYKWLLQRHHQDYQYQNVMSNLPTRQTDKHDRKVHI